MKDRFSSQAHLYVKYRPQYPPELFELIMQHCPLHGKAWDCGTGNGQIAQTLAHLFKDVYATDISIAQLQQAKQHPRIHYSQQAAEQTNFPNAFFDLVIVAQAIHWFNFDDFYRELTRTIKRGGLFVVTGYNRPAVNPVIDKIVTDFYLHTIGAYWDKERKHIDENYTSIPFPFKELQTPDLFYRCNWTLEDFIGYLNTWSAISLFIKANGYNPVDALGQKLQTYWPPELLLQVNFPVLLRMAHIPGNQPF